MTIVFIQRQVPHILPGDTPSFMPMHTKLLKPYLERQMLHPLCFIRPMFSLIGIGNLSQAKIHTTSLSRKMRNSRAGKNHTKSHMQQHDVPRQAAKKRAGTNSCCCCPKCNKPRTMVNVSEDKWSTATIFHKGCHSHHTNK